MRTKSAVLAIVFASVMLVWGCSPAPPSAPKDPKGAAVRILRSLHDKIVYVVDEEIPGTDRCLHRLYWIDPAEKKPHELLSTEATETDGRITTVYLPGRDKMLVHMAVSQNTRTGSDYVADIDGSNPGPLMRGRVTDFFPDGRLLVSSDLSEGGQTYFLYEADSAGTILSRITHRPRGVKRKIGPEYMYVGDWTGVVSPDGTTIMYGSGWYSQAMMRADLCRVSADGSGWKRLTHGARTVSGYEPLGFSHDGTRVAVYETRAESVILHFMDSNARSQGSVDFGDCAVIDFGGWSPDDDRVALINDGYELQICDVATGKLTTIAEVDGECRSISSATWLE